VRTRSVSSAGVATLIVVFAVAPGTASGQGTTAPAARRIAPATASADTPAYTPPRTPDGQPDISGLYIGLTAPGAVEAPLVPIPPRGPNPLGGEFSFNLNERPPLPEGAARRPLVVDPPDGKIPLQPWALEKRKEIIANQDKLEYLDGRVLCLPPGLPRTNLPAPVVGYQILQKPGYVVIFYEQSHLYRIIPLDGRPHLHPNVRMAMGDSRGHWEGNTLVVEATNFTTTFPIHNWVAGTASVPEGVPAESLSTGHGIPRSEAYRVVERFIPIDAERIRYEATIEDPKVFTQPWKMSWDAFRRAPADYVFVEYACHEGNANNLQLMLGVDITRVRVNVP
jgi:hypothetical protein